MRIEANCKINIGLNIVARRNDGYHELESVIYPIMALHDIIDIERINQGVEFRGEGLIVECSDEDNLCIKAARLMQREYDIDGLRITLDKRVPFGAGLGGGSSDATMVLRAINELFELSLSEEQLITHAAELGSDTPFFVRNRAQLCRGRGEIMSDIELDLSGYKIVLIKPEGINISTREAYAGVSPEAAQYSLAEALKLPVEQWQGTIKNDFESSLFPRYAQLKRIKEALLAAGALYASMSGSGSTIYGIFNAECTTTQLGGYQYIL